MQSKHSNDKIFAVPQKVKSIGDCYFYHTIELPGHGVMNGDWDLRRGVDDYLGKVVFAGKRVLEIGPASGFLTFEMEKRGAEVTSVEVTAEHGWDFVPYPASRLEEVFGPRRIVMERLKNSYWFSHAAQQSKAKVYYGDVYNLPSSLGEFDIAVMGAGTIALPRPAPNRGAMRGKSQVSHYYRHVPPRFGRSADLPSCADSTKFSLAHLVAFQHAVLHPISSGHGAHDDATFNASAISSRKSAYALYCRRPNTMRTTWRCRECYEINSPTRDFSSFNSATDVSIFARLKSLIGTPCTISHFPPCTRTGNDEINPLSTS